LARVAVIAKTKFEGGGGGASGGAGGGSNAKVWTREKFDSASHFERSEFAKSGGKVVD